MPRLRTLVLIAGDFSLVTLMYLLSASVLAWVGWYPDLHPDFWDAEFYPRIFLVVGILMVGLYFLGYYEQIRVDSRRLLLEDLVWVFGMAFLVQALLSYTRSWLVMPRWMMMGGSVVAILVLVWWRWLYSLLLVRVVGLQRVLFLGDDSLVRQIAQEMVKHPERGFGVAGCVSSVQEGQFPGGPWVDVQPGLRERINELKPDRIAVSGRLETGGVLERELLECSMQGLQVETIGDLYELIFQRVALQEVSSAQLVFSGAFRPPQWVQLSQEVYGRLVALAGLIVFSPVMLLTAIAVKLDSEGPAILEQIRIGRGGKTFRLLKFRSMHVNVDAKSGPVRAQENDPRVTRVGRWIRVTRIDETPQFWNVLRGDMSLVGPRPEMPDLERELLRHIPLYPQRHRVKPGITGWAQIHHEPEDSFLQTQKKLEYDLYYIKRMSMAFDLIIMFHTAKAVLLRLGAR